MEEKKTLGKFIQTKRKEKNLSQKQLAAMLYVTESAVSKWERGISYPDITMISGICSALEISEHELCTASEDYKQRETERMAKSYVKFKWTYTLICCACYLSALIPCFISNIVNEHRLSWFFILLTSLMLTASIINVPMLARKNKCLITLLSTFISLNLLLLSGCIYSGGDWFIMAFLSVLMGFCYVFMPFILKSEPLKQYIGNKKGLICLTSYTLVTILEILYGTLKYSEKADTISGLTTVIILFAIIWAIFLVIRYTKFNGILKAGICSSIIGTFILVIDFFLNKIYTGDHKIYFLTINNIDISLYVALCFLGIGIILAIIGITKHLKSNK